MADIVQLDPYQCLIRKIGYSVGLESLLERVANLVDLYVEQRQLTLATFKDLVDNTFKRKNATQHFADVYKELNIVKFVGSREQDTGSSKREHKLYGDLLPLHNLETLSILRRYLADNDAAFLTAAKSVLLMAILEADGDIFLNGLASDFAAEKFKLLLIDMIKKKRESISRVIKSPAVLRKVYSVIDIKSQPSQKSQERLEPGESATSRFAKRTIPLDIVKRTTSLSDGINEEVDIPDDYLRKVPATRKGWAEDLDLFADGSKTPQGLNLLEALDKYLKAKQETGCYVLWPYSKDLARLQIKPADIDAPELNPWLLLCAMAEGSSGLKVEPYDEQRDYSDVIAKLKEFYRLYREGNVTYGSIRHQLPLYIAEPCFVAMCAVSQKDIPPLPTIIGAESKKPFRRINKITITGTEGGVVFSDER